VKGKRSLFEEEMFRVRSNLAAVRSLSAPALVIIDEIFSSTNPVEGIAGAFAVARHLALNRNCISVSTHYTYLCRLVRERDALTGARLFRNFQMPVAREEGKKMAYPYKLVPGVCFQYVAIELLRDGGGFEPALIDDAMRIKDDLQSEGKEPKREHK